MTQTWALLVDAYRELNSKKLFWITLILSAVVVLICGVFGINDQGVTFLHWQFETPFFTTEQMSAGDFYKMIFAVYAIPIWLTWAAAILALISTGGLFPDFISSGSIELTLSKPIGRWRLFFTKYACGLLFAGLQVLVFSLAAFLVIGVRGKSWEWGLFLAVPIVVVFFSYLYAICVLLGVITRSAIASILLTLLIWFGISMIGQADGAILAFKTMYQVQAEDAEKRAARTQSDLEAMRTELVETESDESVSESDRQARVASLTGRIGNREQSLREAQEDAASGLRTVESIEPWHNAIIWTRTLLPKTGETAGLLGRWLVDVSHIPGMQERGEEESSGLQNSIEDPRVARRMQEQVNKRPVWWVVGTSLGFEAVVLLLAGWLFVRRDF